MLAAKKVKRYLCAHFSMHFVYIVEFLCPPVYLEHPISQAFWDLAPAKAVNPRTRTVANAIASVLRIIFSPGSKPPLMRPNNSFAAIAYPKKTGSPIAGECHERERVSLRNVLLF
jgi:hypothetical protein